MNEPKSNDDTASTPDQLINSGISSSVELSEPELNGVSGGTGTIVQPASAHQDKQKSALKAADAVSAFIRS